MSGPLPRSALGGIAVVLALATSACQTPMATPDTPLVDAPAIDVGERDAPTPTEDAPVDAWTQSAEAWRVKRKELL